MEIGKMKKTIKKHSNPAEQTKALLDEQKVAEFMRKLSHPLLKEMEELRTILKSTVKGVGERIKWNAPSYYYTDDIVTFNPRATQHVHLVFHHPSVEKIKSPLLEGDYKGRRMAYFSNMNEIKAAK